MMKMMLILAFVVANALETESNVLLYNSVIRYPSKKVCLKVLL